MDNLTWVHWPDERAVTKGMENLSKFSDSYSIRKEKYSDYTPSQDSLKIAYEIEENGYARIKSFIDLDIIDSINKKTEEILSDGLNPYNQNKISQSDARDSQLYIQVLQPLVSAPEIHKLVFDDRIIDIAGAYMDCYPAFGTCNLRKSFVNSMGEGGSQIYHVDPNSPRFLKFFVYMDDVDMDGGPFSYVQGSHTKKFELNGMNWNKQYSWSTEQINKIYGENAVKFLTAKKGDLLVADTNGWHRGIKPKSKERTMLTLDYVCHVEFFEEKSKFEFRKEDYDLLSNRHKQLCDLLKLV